jgi:hypothetical protein
MASQRFTGISGVCLPVCALFLTAVCTTSPAFSSSSFDGVWSVVVQTRSGGCEPTVRYPVAISNGFVTNAGNSQVAVSGRVTPSGSVSVTVQSGGASANGAGRLSMTSGTGVWQGQGANGSCEGTWQAMRQNAGAPIYNYAPQSAPRYYYPSYPGYYPGYR